MVGRLGVEPSIACESRGELPERSECAILVNCFIYIEVGKPFPIHPLVDCPGAPGQSCLVRSLLVPRALSPGFRNRGAETALYQFYLGDVS